jgi:hypothetical protein
MLPYLYGSLRNTRSQILAHRLLGSTANTANQSWSRMAFVTSSRLTSKVPGVTRSCFNVILEQIGGLASGQGIAIGSSMNYLNQSRFGRGLSR